MAKEHMRIPVWIPERIEMNDFEEIDLKRFKLNPSLPALVYSVILVSGIRLS